MVISTIAIIATLQSAPIGIERDAYGIPHVRAASEREAFRLQGYAVAQDRLWQLELSRRVARGKMAELTGDAGLNSDKEFARMGYTDQELDEMFARQSSSTRLAFESYAQGICDYMEEAIEKKTLPKGYEANAIGPEAWSVRDSIAICVQMTRLFGTGGAGELRNYALYLYLKSQPCRDRALDVIDDLAWFNDPRSIPTVSPADDPLKNTHYVFAAPTRKTTEAQIAALPKASAIELLPAIRLASNESSKVIAMRSNTLYKVGSYAIVIGKNRSKTGNPFLLSGPQMGHSTPSVVHQVNIDCPTYKAEGFSVPGIPGVLVGATPKAAWGLTSGVADTADIFYYPSDGDTYEIDGSKKPFGTARFTIRVKGSTPLSIVQKRTEWGPVILESAGGKCAYVQRSSLWMHELDGFDKMLELHRDFSPESFAKIAPKLPPSFNFFYATTSGDIGYRYCGWVPMRAPGLDPRFPTLALKANDWRGMIPAEKMPHVENPASGLIVNWNNKPAAWWANGDTPVWGRLFRNQAILEQLSSGKLGDSDLERAIWAIARRDDATLSSFVPFAKLIKSTHADALNELCAFDGWNLDGNTPAGIYAAFVDALREQIFFPSTGNFLSAANARQILQPSAMLNALEQKTKYQYFKDRTREAIVTTAFEKTSQKIGSDPNSWRFKAGGIRVPDQPAIPYSNRGTYIQIMELAPNGVFGRNIASPGISESGPHSLDQIPLSRAWLYRPMRLFNRP